MLLIGSRNNQESRKQAQHEDVLSYRLSKFSSYSLYIGSLFRGYLNLAAFDRTLSLKVHWD